MKPPPKAFTLVELLVVMTIIALLSVAALVDYGTSVKKTRLQVASEQLIVLLEDAGVRARTNYQEESNCWGIHLEPSENPMLYAMEWDDGCDTSVSNFTEDKELNWPSQVMIEGLLYTTVSPSTGVESESTANSLWVVFYPPDGDISVYDGITTLSAISYVTSVDVAISYEHSDDPIYNKTLTITPVTSSFVLSSDV